MVFFDVVISAQLKRQKWQGSLAYRRKIHAFVGYPLSSFTVKGDELSGRPDVILRHFALYIGAARCGAHGGHYYTVTWIWATGVANMRRKYLMYIVNRGLPGQHSVQAGANQCNGQTLWGGQRMVGGARGAASQWPRIGLGGLEKNTTYPPPEKE